MERRRKFVDRQLRRADWIITSFFLCRLPQTQKKKNQIRFIQNSSFQKCERSFGHSALLTFLLFCLTFLLFCQTVARRANQPARSLEGTRLFLESSLGWRSSLSASPLAAGPQFSTANGSWQLPIVWRGKCQFNFLFPIGKMSSHFEWRSNPDHQQSVEGPLGTCVSKQKCFLTAVFQQSYSNH